jgi:C4-dicarboxylate transporter DctM subunit
LDFAGSARQAAQPPRWARWDEWLAGTALALMTLIPLAEMAMRPMLGRGVDNAPLLVQHLGLVLAMLGALAAERQGHLTTLGSSAALLGGARLQALARVLAQGSAALVCGLLALASWRFVASEIQAHQPLAYGVPVWWVMACMPLGFALLGAKLGARCASGRVGKAIARLALPAAGWALAAQFDGTPLPLVPAVAALLLALLAGAPIFAVLGGLALALFWSDALPLASVALSHYQITVNPSLPALAAVHAGRSAVFARTGAASRLGATCSLALFGGGVGMARYWPAAVLCSAFTAITGGSGVTILALGGLLLAAAASCRLCRSSAASGWSPAPAPWACWWRPRCRLIMYAVHCARAHHRHVRRRPVLPAVVMVASACCSWAATCAAANGLMDATPPVDRCTPPGEGTAPARLGRRKLGTGRRRLVAIGSIVAGVATPTESRCPHGRLCPWLTQAAGPPRAGPAAAWGACLADCAHAHRRV